MFQVHTFPAQDGDCFLLSYGDEGRPRHVLIDGGRASTYATLRAALRGIAEQGGCLDLLVLTHIDADHIEGFLKLAQDKTQPVRVAQVWFNGFDQLSALEAFSPGQGDRFSDALHRLGWSWNTSFEGGSVSLAEGGKPRRISLESGLQLTLLSPDSGKLSTLRKAWQQWRDKKAVERETPPIVATPEELEELGRRPIPYPIDVEALADEEQELDTTVHNGSSIAFIAGWERKRCLMAGDAHTDLLVNGLRSLAEEENGTYRIDLLKVSHHGSAGNTSRELLELIDCPHFLFSTDGSRHEHPDPQTISRILKYCHTTPKTLYFNHRQDYTTPWNMPSLCQRYRYECRFPETMVEGQIRVQV